LLAQLGTRVSCSAGCASVASNVSVELVHHCLISVDEFVNDLHKGDDGGSTRLVDLHKDLVILDAFLAAIDDLVISDANTSVAVLEELVGGHRAAPWD
jgi:hypothetical protein